MLIAAPVMIGGRHHEGQMAFEDESLQQQLDFIADASVVNTSSSSSLTAGKKYKCDKKCCSVGRNQAKRSSWFRQKIHFVDVAKLRQPKLCMKTHLVGDDCKPLLIKAGEDINVPLATTQWDVLMPYIIHFKWVLKSNGGSYFQK